MDKNAAFIDKLTACLLQDNIRADFYERIEDCIGYKKSSLYSLILINIECCKEWIFEISNICRHSNVPIVLLSEKRNVADVVTAFRLGADDYILNSTDTIEIALRIQAVLRRYTVCSQENNSDKKLLSFKDIQIDVSKHTVLKNNVEIQLTKTEFELLHFLAIHKEQILSREQLCEGVWSNEFVADDRSIISHIHRLRIKIEDNPAEPEHILTVRGIGYKFVSH